MFDVDATGDDIDPGQLRESFSGITCMEGQFRQVGLIKRTKSKPETSLSRWGIGQASNSRTTLKR